MKKLLTVLLAALAVPVANAQNASIRDGALQDWTRLKDTMMKISDAMPEEKFSFRATPPERTFGEQILHVAEANVVQMGRLESKAAAPVVNVKATSKAEILKALADSFDFGTAALNQQTDESMLRTAATTRFDRFMGASTRARVVYYVIGHTWDIYGQMVVYLRLNGFTPPASQRF
ncbi:MAG TPA: DinB family protein [Vicinamibacterales bacterium]|nr:DinB family protein [Vicinamibacterales bacterium]